MHFFSSKDEEQLSLLQRSKLYLADSLIRDIDSALEDKSKNNLRSIKSAILDIVVLAKILENLGYSCVLKGELKEIRNSLAHVDERMENFNFLPIEVGGFKTSRENEGAQIKTSISLNFQGAVDNARVGVSLTGQDSKIKVVSLYGMVDDEFFWVDKKGNQRSTSMAIVLKEYKKLLTEIKSNG